MLRCCLCMKWMHPMACCGDSEEDANHLGFYTCILCRNLSDRLNNIEKTVENLHHVNKDLIRVLEDREQECKTLRKLLQESNAHAGTDVHNSASKAVSKKPIPAPRTSLKRKVTLLGTSMVINTGPIISSKLPEKDTLAFSVSGLTIEKTTLMAPSIFNKFGKADTPVLQVGTNDLQESTADGLIKSYDKLIDAVKTTAPVSKVVVTAVPLIVSPDSSNLNQKASRLNGYLQSRCKSDNNLIFVDASPQLSESNYKSYDGLHFNYKGTSYFANYLCEYLKQSENFQQLGQQIEI